jgi:dienelactone hydrolase
MQWMPSRPALAFEATDAKTARVWQTKARKAFEKSLGPAIPQVPLRVKKLATDQCEGYRRDRLAITTAEGIQAIAWYCVPDGLSPSRGAKRPAILATPGHGIGARDLISLKADGTPRAEGQGYQKDYAIQAVRLGYPTLVVEPMGFGERRDPEMLAGKSSESGCHAAFTVGMMLGYTLARIRINDLQKGIDFLQEQSVDDPEKIGMIGISGGGQMTLWTTAIEPRIKAAVVSGYFNTFKASVMGIHHCICNFIPGVAQQLDMVELGGLVAPRPLLIESGTQDPIFPIDATRSAIKKLKQAYSVMNAGDNLHEDIFVGEHQWSGLKVPDFFRRAFEG